MLNPKNLKNGQTQFEDFSSSIDGKNHTQFDYRHTDGVLFSTIADSLADAIRQMKAWIKKHESSTNLSEIGF